jgi:hypothetical protein
MNVLWVSHSVTTFVQHGRTVPFRGLRGSVMGPLPCFVVISSTVAVLLLL